jgi:hypothetical protein
MSTSTLSHVYVVMVNNKAIHSICSTEEVADQICDTVKNCTKHKFPLIQKFEQSVARTESYNPLAFLENDEEQYDDDQLPDVDFDDDQSVPLGSGEYEDEFGDDMIDRTTPIGGSDDEPDVVCMDVPLTLRLLEWSREESSDDVDLHKVTENLVSLGTQLDEVLTMDHYDQVLEGVDGDDRFGDGEYNGDDEFDLDAMDDYTDDIDAAGYGVGSDDEFDVNQPLVRESLDPSIAPILRRIAAGELEIDDVTNSNDRQFRAAGKYLSRMYDEISAEKHLHGDDDFESIYEIMYDLIERQFGNRLSTNESLSAFSRGKKANKAGRPLAPPYPKDSKDYAEFVRGWDSIEAQRKKGGLSPYNVNESKVETLADFMNDVEESGTTVPSVKDIYKQKRSETKKPHTRSEVVQDGADDQPYKIATSTTDKK